MEAEGLQLRFSSSSTGYEGVEYEASDELPFRTTFDGCELGRFATAIDGAMCFARHMREQEVAEMRERDELGASCDDVDPPTNATEPLHATRRSQKGRSVSPEAPVSPPPRSPREASGLGEICQEIGEGSLLNDLGFEGRELDDSELFVSARSSTGYLGVYHHARARTKPFYVQVLNPVTKKVQTGASFATAREAAVYYAEYRRMAGMFEEDEAAQPEPQPGELPRFAGGMELHLSDRSATGYRGVYVEKQRGRKNDDRSFFVQVTKPHVFRLGNYHTAVEAAVAFAKYEQLRQTDSDITGDITGGFLGGFDLQTPSTGIFDGDEPPEAAPAAFDFSADSPRNCRDVATRGDAWPMPLGGWEALLNGGH